MNKNKYLSKIQAFEKLLSIMEELRMKCPWDQKQTMMSLRHLTLEESFELSEAILNQDYEEIKKELGDLLLHIVFYALIAEEKNLFDIENVIETLCQKLIFRHPHIYGNTPLKNEEEVKSNWEKLKLQEAHNKKVLDGVPLGLPALLKSLRIQEKVSRVGFDWKNKDDVWDKVQEELEEFKEEKDPEKKEIEWGDLLFSLINYARHLHINPEDALEKSNKKFIQRFNFIEKTLQKEGKKIENLSQEEWDKYWEKGKK